MAKHALCIGIDQYGVGAQLAGCVNDANDWATRLADRGYQAETLLDDRATRVAILDGIRQLLGQVGYGDTVLITYSGHGTWLPDADGDEPDHRDEQWCPYDYRDNLISDDDLAHLLDARPYGARVVVVSDSCHSGTVTRLADSLVPGRGRVRFLPPQQILERSGSAGTMAPVDDLRLVQYAPINRRSPGALLLAGCRDTEYSYEVVVGGRTSGAFTHVALSAWGGLAAGARVLDLYRAIRQQLPSQDCPQTPQLFGLAPHKRWVLF